MKSLISQGGLFPRLVTLFLVGAATMTYGCGSSAPTVSDTAGKNPAKKLNPDQLYKWEGTGAAKRKVEISRRERVKLLHEAAEKSD
jgi:hypothetical protein